MGDRNTIEPANGKIRDDQIIGKNNIALLLGRND